MEELYTSADAEKVVTGSSTNVRFGSFADIGPAAEEVGSWA